LATTPEIARDFHIPVDAVRHIDPTSPVPVRMMGAAGTLPLPPKVLMSVLYVLLGDPDEKVAKTARVSLQGLPTALIVKNIDGETHHKVLEYMAFHRPEEEILETVALRRQTNDKTICYLAETASANIVEIIAGNQERALVTPEVYLHLKANPEISPDLLERMASWQRMNGIVLEADELREAPAVDEAPLEPEPQRPPPFPPDEEYGPDDLGPPPVMEPGASEFLEEFAPEEGEAAPPPILGADDPFLLLMQDLGIELRPEYFDAGPALDDEDEKERAEREARMMGRDHLEADDVNSDGGSTDLLTPMTDNQFEFSLDRGGDDDWDMDLLSDHDDVDDELRQSIGKRIGKMSVGEKIKLSYLGNKEVREILIKDTNKMVCAAVVKSGRLTDPEVVKASSNRAISEEVLRLIGQNREWLRKYPVKVALINNPKTPAGVSMGLLNSLHIKDLKALQGNKNVPSVVANAASVRVKQRTSH